jgi:CheY-like chemotaxis protein
MAQFNPLKPKTVVVVEDDILVQQELAHWLTTLGFTVLTADNADEAILLLDSRSDIELLLTDIQMPGSMDGVRLAHHVATRWPPVKIIVMSGSPQFTLSDLPANSLLISKPYQPQHLWRALSDGAEFAA